MTRSARDSAPEETPPAPPTASTSLELERGWQRFWLLARSLAVGSLATVFDLGTLALLVHAVGVDPRLASLPALSLGVVAQFLGNKLFAFQDYRADWLRQGLSFLAVEALGFSANLLLFHLAVSFTPLPVLPVRLAITSLVYFGVCLPLWSRIFSNPSRDEPSRLSRG
ncbi:MAG: GtrA family protein [Myxococcales bacterium]|nr:GtrA family protein [Myxococcales bacterium]